MSKRKIILLGAHGRPSIGFSVFPHVIPKEVEMVVKRNLPNGKSYYRQYIDEYKKGKNTKENKLYNKIEEKDFSSISDCIVVRWGSRCVLDTDKSTIVYNQSRGIAQATNKKQTREILIDHSIPVPPMVDPSSYEDGQIVISRPSSHSKGANFVILGERRKFEEHYHAHHEKGWYYSLHIDKESEYRVHVAHSKVLAVMEKPKPSNGSVAWNRSLSSDDEVFSFVRWRNCNKKHIHNAMVAAIESVNALGLDMGGVDVICKGDNAYVLEVNTCPTLISSDYVGKRWAMYFSWLFRKESRRDHFPSDWVKSREKGSSLIWTEEQLNN